MEPSQEFRDAFTRLFRSFSPDQLSALQNSLWTVAQEQAMRSGGAPATASSLHGGGAGFRANHRKAVLDGTKPKRPLNAFITFRSEYILSSMKHYLTSPSAYYSPLFKGLPQKLKSGLLRQMWAAENKQAMWALLGAAYSDLRDHHVQTLSVEKFLSVAIPLLPIIPAEAYLSEMGWSLQGDGLCRDPQFNADILAAQYPSGTGWSVKNIVNHCYNQGLMDRATRTDPGEIRRQDFRTVGLMGVDTASNQNPPATCGSLTLAVTPQSVGLFQCMRFFQY